METPFEPPLPSRTLVVQRQPIYLSEEDIHLTPAALRKHAMRRVVKFIAFLIAPLIIGQALAFGSFIYEESLQAAGFAIRGAMLAEDAVIAYAATKNFETVMLQAQNFQNHFGFFAFWTDGAYRAYFFRAAPGQLLGYYVEGKKKGLWGEVPTRWAQLEDNQHHAYGVDTWKPDPFKAIATVGFNPELPEDKPPCPHCAAQEQAEKEILIYTRGGLRISDEFHAEIIQNANNDRGRRLLDALAADAKRKMRDHAR